MELVAVDDDLPQCVGPGDLLALLLLAPGVHPHVGPGNVLRPPRRLRALLPPAWLPSPRAVLQHERDEGSQLSLGHLLHRCWDPVHHNGRQLVQILVNHVGRGRLLRERRLQLRHDDCLEVPHHVLQGFGSECSEVVD